VRLKATIHGQILTLKLMPVILLVIGFASAMQLWMQTVDATAKSERQNAVFSAAQVLLQATLDAETGARGYVATGKIEFLVPYDRERPTIPARAHALLSLVRGDDIQLSHARRVEELAAQEAQILARCVALMHSGKTGLARTELVIALRAGTMEDFRAEIGLLESAAQRDAMTTLALMKTAGIQTLYTLVCCVFLAIIFAASAAWKIRRAIRVRVNLLVRKAQRLAAGEDIGPRLGGVDEISELDDAFHNMAELLAERTVDLERYRLLAERTECLILFARRRDGRILHANAAALAAYGYSNVEMRELTVDALRLGAVSNTVAEQLTTPSAASLMYEASQLRSDGSTFPGEVTVEGRLIAGEHVQVSIVRDISERKRAESLVADALCAAQNAARAKADFLATMSHEIRTPMNAVIGMTELVMQTALTAEQREALQIVNDSGEALLRIIDDILDFSKIEAGKFTIEIIEFPFAKTIESVAVTLAAQARSQALTLSVFVDPQAPATLYGDAGRIRQVLTNLVGNALKFTHAGSVTLGADVTSVGKEWCDVRFSVADTGIGIAAEHLSRIFQPFAQADASTTRVYGGSGLGLSICQQLVGLMGGELRADSAPGRGSTFSFVLRLRAGEANVPVAHSGLRALVVDASQHATSELTRYIRAWGVDVRVVSSSAAALAACSQATGEGRSFDVVIVDEGLLGSAAYALGRALGVQSANTRRILVAPADEPGRRTAAVAAGFTAYLGRPLRQSQIFDCIMNVSPVPACAPAATQTERTGRSILLAEDNMINQRVALQQLYKLGYDVTVVGTGRAALAAVIGKRFDIVLMDCFMPEMDGYAATIAIRRHQARTGEHTPIIAMTANAQSDDRDICIAAGMDDYLSKPVTIASLRDALARYSGQRDSAPSRDLALEAVTTAAKSAGAAIR